MVLAVFGHIDHALFERIARVVDPDFFAVYEHNALVDIQNSKKGSCDIRAP
jgi:hypothetical protein